MAVEIKSSNSPGPSGIPIMYGGFTRFEIELEFVQCLGNPSYVNYLATTKLLYDPAFIAYLDYLQYFRRPEYVKHLSYPAPTLKMLELLQQEQFRKDILIPEVVARLIEGGVRAALGETSIPGTRI